jgi:hypothetical protein
MANEPQLFSAEPVPPTGMSGTTKLLVGLGCGCSLAILACAGIVGTVVWTTTRYVKEAASDEPATIRRLTNEIVSIEVPATLEPRISFDAKVPFSKEPLGVAVFYASKADDAELMLIELRAPIADKREREKIEAQIHEFLEKGDRPEKRVRVESSTPHDVTIHGEPGRFVIGKGVSPDDKRPMWQVTGEFAGAQGPSQFRFVGPVDAYSEADLLQMLDSMQDPKVPLEDEKKPPVDDDK